MAGPLEAITGNPVFVKELRVRMRGARAFWLLGIYLVVLGGVLYLTYSTWWSSAQTSAGYASGSSGEMGQYFFLAIMGVEAFLVAFITPALTAGAITIEREQKTIDLLQMTPMSRGAIVGGKLAAAYAFIALLIVSSLPLTSICFLVGGVSPAQVAQSYMTLLAACLVTGALGIAWSSVSSSTTSAVVLTYGSILVPGLALMTVGPVVGLAAAGGQAPVWIGSLMLPVMLMLGAPGSFSPSAGFSWDYARIYGLALPTWLPPVIVYGLASAVLGAVAARRLEGAGARPRSLLRWLVALAFASQLFFLYGTSFAPHWQARAAVTGFLGSQPLLGALMFPAFVLILAVPVFCTGEVADGDRGSFGRFLARGWTPQGWRRLTLASGLPYVLLLLALALAMYFAGFAAAGSPGAVLTGTLGGAFRAPHGAVVTMGGFPEAVICMASSIIGLAALGLLLSIATSNRWSAMALLYFVIIMIIVAPLVALGIGSVSSVPGQPSLMATLGAYGLYLNPLVCIASLAEAGHWSLSTPVTPLGASAPYWLVCPIAYLLIAGLSLLLIAEPVRRGRAGAAARDLRRGGREKGIGDDTGTGA